MFTRNVFLKNDLVKSRIALHLGLNNVSNDESVTIKFNQGCCLPSIVAVMLKYPFIRLDRRDVDLMMISLDHNSCSANSIFLRPLKIIQKCNIFSIRLAKRRRNGCFPLESN